MLLKDQPCRIIRTAQLAGNKDADDIFIAFFLDLLNDVIIILHNRCGGMRNFLRKALVYIICQRNAVHIVLVLIRNAQPKHLHIVFLNQRLRNIAAGINENNCLALLHGIFLTINIVLITI